MVTSTIPTERPIERILRARAMRRAFDVLLFAFVAAGLLDVFGEDALRAERITVDDEQHHRPDENEAK